MPVRTRDRFGGFGRRDVLIAACASSAGIHAALAPDHFREAVGAGTGFAAAAVLLAGLVVALGRRPDDRLVPAAAAGVLLGLIVSWVLAVTTGVPLLHPEPEPVEGFAVMTKAIEAAGLLVAATLLHESRPATVHQFPNVKGTRA